MIFKIFLSTPPSVKTDTIVEDIGYPSYIKNKTELAAKLENVSYSYFLTIVYIFSVPCC